MKRWLVLIALVLFVTTASAMIYVNPFYKAPPVPQVSAVACRTNLDCFQAAKSFTGTCMKGYVIDREPTCHGGQCMLCKTEQPRLRIVCRYDDDCKSQISCSNALNAQCSGNRCTCSTQPHVECHIDHDCMRSLYLLFNYQRMVCSHGKCMKPAAQSTLSPQYIIPKNLSMMPHY